MESVTKTRVQRDRNFKKNRTQPDDDTVFIGSSSIDHKRNGINQAVVHLATTSILTHSILYIYLVKKKYDNFDIIGSPYKFGQSLCEW